MRLNFGQWAEATQRVKWGQCNGHFRFVIGVFVEFRLSGVQDFCEFYVGMRLQENEVINSLISKCKYHKNLYGQRSSNGQNFENKRKLICTVSFWYQPNGCWIRLEVVEKRNPIGLYHSRTIRVSSHPINIITCKHEKNYERSYQSSAYGVDAAILNDVSAVL
jgi:hypothetical protein